VATNGRMTIHSCSCPAAFCRDFHGATDRQTQVVTMPGSNLSGIRLRVSRQAFYRLHLIVNRVVAGHSLDPQARLRGIFESNSGNHS
jgi:hypothetical protein